MEERIKAIEAKLKEMEKAFLVIATEGRENKTKNSSLNDGLAALGESISELFVAIKSIQGNNNTGGGVEINEETLALHVKKILLDDADLLETFKKVIENITIYNHNKDKVDGYVEEKNLKKSSSFLHKNKFSFLVLFFVIIATGFFWFNFSPATIQITPSDMIYTDSNSKGFQIAESFEYKIIKIQDGKTYFSADGKIYYVKKKTK